MDGTKSDTFSVMAIYKVLEQRSQQSFHWRNYVQPTVSFLCGRLLGERS